MKKWLLSYRKREQKDSSSGERWKAVPAHGGNQLRAKEEQPMDAGHNVKWKGLMWFVSGPETFGVISMVMIPMFILFFILAVRLKLEYFLIPAGWDDTWWTPCKQLECYSNFLCFLYPHLSIHPSWMPHQWLSVRLLLPRKVCSWPGSTRSGHCTDCKAPH